MNKIKSICGVNLILCLGMVFFAMSCHRQSRLEVYDLQCENLSNPLGIDKTTPRFSWKIKSKKNGTKQKAFQLLVASDISRLNEKEADLWESGKIESESSIFIPYKGEKLHSGSVAYWKVRVWDEENNASSWSEPARFSIGLLNEADWQASYIAFNTEAGYRECPQLYKTFEVADTNSSIFLHVNSLGYHEVYLNGQKVGKGVLVPAVSQFDKRSLINTYDITSLIKKGKNDLIIWLGSGWYTTGLPGVVNDGPVVRAQLEKVKNNQREIILTTDSTWLGRKSSYTRHGNWRPHRFGGEIMNGSLAKEDLCIENNQTKKWEPVSEISIPLHEVSPQMVEPNIIADTIHPVSIIALAPDTFLVDMGKNLTGWVEIHFPKLEKSQSVKMEYCDHLIDGQEFYDMNQYDLYLASGTLPEIFVNKFNYHGFRYIRITGLKEMPVADSIKAFLIHTDYKPASGFECSDPDMNRIHDMIWYTLQCLSLGGDLVDCPHLERLGYGGDGNASTLTAQTMFNLSPLYNNWLQAWADVIRDDGGMPHTAPNPYPAGGGPYWCGFIITATWNTFLNYGDTLLLQKYYPVMQKWLGYVDKYTVNGLLKRWPDTDYRNWYLGDWATPTGIDQTAETSVDLVNNSFVVVCLDNMQKIAHVLGKKEEETLYATKKEQLRKTIHETFFNESNNTYGTGTQIDLAFPMIAGVVPKDRLKDVEKSFYKETEINRRGHFACGLVGIPVVTEWAIKNQAVDLMYSMLKKRDYPGYLYMIDNGATTTWEHWDGARSHIHNCYNGIGSWFYQAIGGIRPVEDVPAYRKICIQPQIPKEIRWAKTFKETPWGKLSVNWVLKNDQTMEIDLEIPVGMEVEVILPIGANQFTLKGKKHQLKKGESQTIKLKSGKYKISYKNPL
ncbi:MAG: family 78 glycoside hydrolase catalytic domain [Dysgonamonadaceae bacterium]